LRLVTWNEYLELLKKLGEDVRASNFDNIVGIGRGGCIMAAYLASKLGVPTFTSVFVRHVIKQDGQIVKLEVQDEDIMRDNIKSLSGRLLVVDDSLIEGRAMRFVLDQIPRSSRARSLVMYVRTGAQFKPDFVGAYFDEKERDIIFPYDPPLT